MRQAVVLGQHLAVIFIHYSVSVAIGVFVIGTICKRLRPITSGKGKPVGVVLKAGRTLVAVSQADIQQVDMVSDIVGIGVAGPYFLLFLRSIETHVIDREGAPSYYESLYRSR